MNTKSGWNEIGAQPQLMSTIKASRSTSNIATSYRMREKQSRMCRGIKLIMEVKKQVKS